MICPNPAKRLIDKKSMARVLLRHILSPKSELTSLVQSLLLEMNADVFIEDTQGNHLLGIPGDATAKFEAPVKIQDEILGWVKGDHRAPHIATLLSVVARKEYDRKSLGSEVLLLYQEVNMVFNFSDKLAQAIDPESIAQIAVEEAMHLIGSVGGVVVSWDEIKKQLQIPATAGNEVFQKEQISSHLSLLLHIGLSGQSEIMDDLSSLKEAGIIGPEVQSVIYAALKVKHRIMGAIILAGDRPAQFAAADLKFLTTLALQSSAAIESALLYEKNIREAREKEEAMRAVYEITAKFVPYEFIGSLGREVITEVRLGDQVEKVVTVLFADLRDFTTLSEQMTPEENFQFISSFNGNMGPIIREHKGFINQYLGDAIMALFPENGAQALDASIAMYQKLGAFNRQRIKNKVSPIRMGVGMHTGPLIMGITGDNDRLDATTISDTVNTASRIENLTKYYHARILISEATLQQIARPEKFHLRYLGRVQVKGKQASTGIHECFDSDAEELVRKKEDSLDAFNSGLQAYLDKSFPEAVRAFEEVVSLNPEDLTAHFFLDNAIRYSRAGVPENWTGVLEMASK